MASKKLQRYDNTLGLASISMASLPTRLSDLPLEILQTICRKLSFVKDYVFFGAVCSLWRDVLFQCRQHIPPVLMLPNSSSHHIPVFCFPDLCQHVLSTKELFYCYGSSHGWLIILRYKQYAHTSHLELLNPFSSVNNVIQLPFPKSVPFKAVLSNDPLKTTDYLVMITDPLYRLSVFKAGDTSWTPVEYDHPVQAITYYRDHLYARCFTGKLISCNIKSTLMPVKTVASLPFDTESLHYRCHLIELAGDLLYFQWTTTSDIKRIQFRVLMVEPRKSEVLELNNLRGHAIFLSYNSLVAVSASDFPNCKPDHIYFSLLECRGAFNLIDKTTQSFELPKFETAPIWIQPTLNMITTTTKIDGPSRNSG